MEHQSIIINNQINSDNSILFLSLVDISEYLMIFSDEAIERKEAKRQDMSALWSIGVRILEFIYIWNILIHKIINIIHGPRKEQEDLR